MGNPLSNGVSLWERFASRTITLGTPRFRRPPPLGLRGERHAARYLRRRGYTVVAVGHRSRFGELDLVAVWQKRVVVFVEVKTRRGRRAGGPEQAVGEEKQRRLTRSALEYLKAHELLEYPARFDVVSIVWPAGARRPASLEHFENAFEPAGNWQFFA